MKWLFGFLLLLGVMFFAVMQWGGPLTGAAKSIQALGELYPEKIKLLDVPDEVQPTALVVTPAHSAVVVVAPLVPPLLLPLAASGTPAVPVSAPVQVAAPLHVLPIAPNFSPAAEIPAKVCMEWGEFSGTDLEKSEKELAVLKLGDQFSKRTVEYEMGYRVFMPSLPNKAAIRKSINEIKAAGIEEYYVLAQSGQWHNAISLGMFKTEEAAKHYLAIVQKKGIHPVKIAVVKRKLQFVVFAIKGLDATGVKKLGKLQKDFPGSELKKVMCIN